MARLFGARVAVIGLGGVGSFAAEALTRSGIGCVDLVDFDLVCITNSNRQLQAMKGTIGKSKAEILGERLALVNPKATINPIQFFYNERTSEKLLHPEGQPLDFVVDAIDNVTAKCHLLATCKQLGIPVVSSTGASGRFDPTAIQVADLAKTKADPLARDVRKILRNQYGFPTGKKKFGIPAVYSMELPAVPQELTYDNGEGFRCVCPGGSNGMHSCEKRSVIYGTAGFVTGTFGMVCASVVVRSLVDME
jgi:tRNA A37 threonylcarbamoyladenosine dehydratase